MSTVTGNLYIVYRLCTVEWAPSFYIRPLDDDLTNLKGSHMLEKRHLPPPLISTQNLSWGLQWRHYSTDSSTPVDRANLHLNCKAQLFSTSVAEYTTSVHHYTCIYALTTKLTIALTSGTTSTNNFDLHYLQNLSKAVPALTHLYLHGVVKVNVESVARAIREKLLRV